MTISKINSQITIEYLQENSENQYFERKGLGTKPSKIANELIGMLNADGGVLVLGISDTGKIEGLQELSDKELSDYRSLVADFISPPYKVKLEEVYIEDKLIFIYHSEQDIENMFKRKDNEEIYLRMHDKNKKLDREAVRILEYDKQIRKRKFAS